MRSPVPADATIHVVPPAAVLLDSTTKPSKPLTDTFVKVELRSDVPETLAKVSAPPSRPSIATAAEWRICRAPPARGKTIRVSDPPAQFPTITAAAVWPARETALQLP